MYGLLYDKVVVCLFCEQKFSTKKVRNSKIIVKRKDSDFCMHYENKAIPYYYEVNVCPHCSFAFTSSFNPLKPVHQEVISRHYMQKTGRIDICHERTLMDAIRSFKLALVCASLSSQSESNFAIICLRIAWLNRFENNLEEERKFMTKVVNGLQTAYEKEDLSRDQLGEDKILYLLGELNGRLGSITNARYWFNILLSKNNVEPAINNLARNQWLEYKELLT